MFYDYVLLIYLNDFFHLAMAFITYILLAGMALGIQKR